MASINSSSLIGAQAYASQLRRQYSQEESERVFSQDTRRANRADNDPRRSAIVLDKGLNRGLKETPNQPVVPNPTASLAPGNPTVGEVSAQPNPPARPLYSSTRIESPNPNAALRHTRPGTHLDITV